MIVNLNGVLISTAMARIDPTDRGFTLGDGLFETMRAYHDQILHLPAHLHRLRAGACVLRLPLSMTDAELCTRLHVTLAASGLSTAVLRLTVSRGPAGRGLLPPTPVTPTILITASPLSPPYRPVEAIIATATRRNQHSPLSRIKSLNALDNMLARQEAADRGVEEALLLNTAGRLAETTVANVFLVTEGGIVQTPPVADGALPGIMRADVMTRLGAVETSLVPEDLFRATEVFVTNALGVRPLVAVDCQPVGSATRVQEILARGLHDAENVAYTSSSSV
ncbi:Aminodeoxychorismate lyase [invertebrate metagenome]|uniref:Aminodeoxychorismate lyase n=1 Tax=invertebrate metagenome TaxID=1711999 RepID=A0A484H5D7_9ZZZZ